MEKILNINDNLLLTCINDGKIIFKDKSIIFNTYFPDTIINKSESSYNGLLTVKHKDKIIFEGPTKRFNRWWKNRLNDFITEDNNLIKNSSTEKIKPIKNNKISKQKPKKHLRNKK